MKTSQIYPIQINLRGKLVNQDDKNAFAQIGNSNHHYYRNQLNAFFGPDTLNCLYDFAANSILWLNTRGGAPFTNTISSALEYLQTFVARSNILGDPESKETGATARQRRFSASGGIQVTSGLTGLGAYLYGFFKGDNKHESMSLKKKMMLSGGMFLSSATAFTTGFEKMLLSVTSRGKENGDETLMIALDAKNDLRASVEYAFMTIYPFLGGLQRLKTVFDIGIPVLALRDGITSFFIGHGGFGKSVEGKFLKTILLAKDKLEDTFRLGVPQILANDILLGENGIRQKLTMPIFKALGCTNMPHIQVAQDGNERVLALAAS